MQPHKPLRLTIDLSAIQANWRWLDKMSGTAACGAAVKANAYGLGAERVVPALLEAGCRDFFVTTYAEAQPLLPLIGGDASLCILHGVSREDAAYAADFPARPVLNSPEQVRRWKEIAPDRPCDVMVDTGMNRLGLTPEEAVSGLLDGLRIETLHSHLASADEDVPQNERQLTVFRAAANKVNARRYSLANSAGICLGPDYHFNLTRPGLALYGGIPRREAEGYVRSVFTVEAQVVQRRKVKAGDTIGYNATFTAPHDMEVAILNLGYADGYSRRFSNNGHARIMGELLPVAGTVSMDLTTILVDRATDPYENNWVEIDLNLLRASMQSGLSQYELLTTLGKRYTQCTQQDRC
ncbi:alanine racemase [Allosphingosinicella flava]|uniref:Alanine racemase n=1 Tax=Allosphingosinicella flava TaxID=2771430 RepID=A0A7T2GMC4_9SPHN|nr:alanine racemase [Sphingosinicella flava]QPQ56178.1 alanine racemase [Sphingosinicella flava]